MVPVGNSDPILRRRPRCLPSTPGKKGCGKFVETDGNGAVKPENPALGSPMRNAVLGVAGVVLIRRMFPR